MRNVKNIDFYEGSNVAILEDYDAARWNALAERTNTRMFIQLNGRDPVDYAEVQEWVRALSEGNRKDTAVTVPFVQRVAENLNVVLV